MKGIQFLVDEHGDKKSVLIDLELWGELWEDIYDNIVAHSVLGEPTITWEAMKEEKDAELEREMLACVEGRHCVPSPLMGEG